MFRQEKLFNIFERHRMTKTKKKHKNMGNPYISLLFKNRYNSARHPCAMFSRQSL